MQRIIRWLASWPGLSGWLAGLLYSLAGCYALAGWPSLLTAGRLTLRLAGYAIVAALVVSVVAVSDS